MAVPPLTAQQPPAPATAPTPARSPAQIKQELEKIKKGRTVAIYAATGSDEPDGTTELRVDNPSPFSMIVFVVGPTTERIELEPQRMQTLTVDPGDYEIAVRVVGRDVPPFYGKQTIIANMQFRHQFVIPAN